MTQPSMDACCSVGGPALRASTTTRRGGSWRRRCAKYSRSWRIARSTISGAATSVSRSISCRNLGEHEGVHFAMGYCGHGVANSVYFGHHLANLMRGQPRTLPFAELPFRARFFYGRHPWFLPLAGGYYKMVDRMERR